MLFVSPVFAGDTIWVMSDTYAGVAPDTFKLQDQRSAADNDDLLLHLVSQQGREIHVRDSLRQDSILQSLIVRDSLLQLQLAQLRDSINAIEQALRPKKKQDSVSLAHQDTVVIDPLQQEMDSLTRELAQISYVNSAVIEKSIFRDVDADLADIARALRDRHSHWRKEANVALHFTQNYISPNWYKGGNSEFAVLALTKGFINYNKDRISWENLGEWRTGVTTTPGDTLRKFNVTDDLFRLYSKFGYRITNHQTPDAKHQLYASASIEFNTTLWNVWNENKSTVKTAFMTPLKFYITAGFDYKPIPDLSIFFAPATYKLVYAYFGDGDSIRHVDVTNYGIKAGENLLSEFGSTLRVQWRWRPVREFTLDTEFYIYTNYKAVEIDWEITGEFNITRFLSIRLMLHPRFDSAYIAEGDTKPKLQFKELLSVGFAHKFR